MDPTTNKTERSETKSQNPIVFVPEPPKPGEWQIGQMYENAFRVARNFRTLWILGLIFGVAGGGCSFQFPAGGGGSNITLPSPSPFPQGIKTSQVLGATTSTFTNSLGKIFANIPTYIYFLIGFEIILLIVLWFAIFYLKGAFANVSTVIGTQKALEGQKLTLSEISNLSLPKIKPMVKFMIISSLLPIPLVTCLVIYAIFVVTKIPIPQAITLLLVTGFIFGFIAIIILLFWSIASPFAIRAISLENYGIKRSIFTGLKMARKKLFWVIIVGIINNILSSLILIIPLLLINFAFVATGGLIGLTFHKALLMMGVFLGVGLMLSFILVLPLLSAMIIIGKTAIWNQAFTKTKEIIDGN